MQKYHKFAIVLFLLVLFATQLANAEDAVTMEFFYTEGCDDCEAAKPIIDEIEQEYADNISIERLEVAIEENWDRLINYNFTLVVPAVVINYEAKISSEEISKEILEKYIDGYLNPQPINETFQDNSPITGTESEFFTFIVNTSITADITNITVTWNHNNLNGTDVPLIPDGNGTWSLQVKLDYSRKNMTYAITVTNSSGYEFTDDLRVVIVVDNPRIWDLPWGGQLHLSDLSLPVLTIILGALDSLNPCSFFVLLFLLNLLIYVRSRKKMLLIGGIFIFFSGFIYFLFMLALFGVFHGIFLLTAQRSIISIIAGVLAVTLGSINIKDYFYFKKGVSLSIPEDKKPKLYKRMREIVKSTYLPSMIVGTVILAIFANTYELFCTLILPTVFTERLIENNLTLFQSYLYIFFYNVVYVIPLIIIVLVVIVKLSRSKLSEWQGRVLKLFSGLMMLLLGLILLLKPDLLNNVFSTIGVLLIALLSAAVIVLLTKKFWKRREPA